LASGTVRWFNEENGYGYVVADAVGGQVAMSFGVAASLSS